MLERQFRGLYPVQLIPVPVVGVRRAQGAKSGTGEKDAKNAKDGSEPDPTEQEPSWDLGSAVQRRAA